MFRGKSTLVDIFMTADFRLVEMFSALSATWWGTWLLLPTITGVPNSFTANSGWRIMAALAPDYVWGILSLVLGLAGLHCLVFNSKVRKWMSSVMFLFWLLLTVSLLLNNAASTGVPVYGMRALACALVYLRLEMAREKV